MRAAEVLHPLRHVVHVDRVDGGNADDRVAAGPGVLHPRDDILVFLQHLAAAVVEKFPLVGEFPRAAGAVNERDAQILLNVLHGLAGAGLQNVIGLGAAREAAEPGHVAINFQRFNLHQN